MATSLVTSSVEEIEAQGGQFVSSSLLFRAQTFRRGFRCRKTMQKAIQDYCKICQQKNENVILIEEDEFISLWKANEDLKLNRVEASRSIAQVQGNEETDHHNLKPEKINREKTTALSPELINFCRQAMLITAGPIANLILKEGLTGAAEIEPIQFIEKLGDRLPNQNLKDRFFQELIQDKLDVDLAEKVKSLLS